MIFKRIIPLFVLVLTFSISYGQQNNSSRKPQKAISSENYQKTDPELVNKKRNQTKSGKHELASGKTIPADFPKYVETGNKEKDRATYNSAKLKWINDNPEKYKALFTKSASK